MQGNINIVFVGSCNGHFAELPSVERLPQFLENDFLGGDIEVAALLTLGILPRRLVERLYRMKLNSPMVGSIARYGGQIDSKALVVGWREAVAPAVAARGAAVGIHPPHGRVGEQLEHICAALASLERHGALVQVSGPIPAG